MLDCTNSFVFLVFKPRQGYGDAGPVLSTSLQSLTEIGAKWRPKYVFGESSPAACEISSRIWLLRLRYLSAAPDAQRLVGRVRPGSLLRGARPRGPEHVVEKPFRLGFLGYGVSSARSRTCPSVPVLGGDFETFQKRKHQTYTSV
jgi:hypothetical protein